MRLVVSLVMVMAVLALLMAGQWWAVLLLFLVAALAGRRAKARSGRGWEQWDKTEQYPYLKKPLLTKREYRFYWMLRQCADAYGWLVCPKVGLKDLLDVDEEEADCTYHFNRISQKHVDFVICDERLRVLFAVELDDASHDTQQARKKDWFKNKAFESAGIPLERVREIEMQRVEQLFLRYWNKEQGVQK